MIVKYMKQRMLIRETDWVSRDQGIPRKELLMDKCIDYDSEEVISPQLIMNQDAPMLFMGHFGLIA